MIEKPSEAQQKKYLEAILEHADRASQSADKTEPKLELVEFAKQDNVIEAYAGDLNFMGNFLIQTESVVAAAQKEAAKYTGLVCNYCDLNERKAYDKEVKNAKKTFTRFDENAKRVKEEFTPYPNGIDRTRRGVKSVWEPIWAKLEHPGKEIEAQNERVEKVWEKNLNLSDVRWEMETLLKTTKESSPSKYSTIEEAAKFNAAKSEYTKAIEEKLEKIAKLEKMEQMEKELQAAKAKELEEQRKAQQAEAERQARVAEEQRKQQAALEAEQKRIAQEAAELERQKQAAVNPASPELEKNTGTGAPPANANRRKEVWDEIDKAIAKLIVTSTADVYAKAAIIRRAIVLGQIPHVTINYGEGNV
ncbi:MAG: hypothetical protein FWB90_00700 [Fibromonadales bacterium]|nr:hypothetical protein [Fibromonadales bacterium]